MSVFGERLKKLRGKQSIDDLVTKLNNTYETKISKSMISRYENGQADPKMENVRIIADYFKVSADYLLGINDDETITKLNKKDEKDIQLKLQEMIDGLSDSSGFAAFDGETFDEMDEEDRELLIASLENSLRLAKRLAKEKFTPKKYK